MTTDASVAAGESSSVATAAVLPEVIDVHGHYTMAPGELDAWRGRQLNYMNKPHKGPLKISDDEIATSLEPLLDQMDQRGIDAVLFSPRASGMGHDLGDAVVSRHWSETNNDLIFRACSMFPSRLIPVCQLPQSVDTSPADWVAELERCVELGFVGCNINPDVSGGIDPPTPSVGGDWWWPLFERMEQLRTPGLIHASACRHPAHHVNGAHYIMQDYSAVVELCASTVFDQYPELKLIVPHGGGGVVFQLQRHRALHQYQGLAPFEECLRRLYFDTALYDADSLEMLVRKVGVDRVLYGSEMFGTANVVDPDRDELFDDNVGFVRALGLADADEQRLLGGNALEVYPRIADWLAANASS